MLETEVETYLRHEVEKLGGLCDKFVSPGRIGVPDRLVTMPYIGMELIETKRPPNRNTRDRGGRLQPHQKRDHQRRRLRGVKVITLYTKAQVDAYIAEVRAAIEGIKATPIRQLPGALAVAARLMVYARTLDAYGNERKTAPKSEGSQACLWE